MTCGVVTLSVERIQDLAREPLAFDMPTTTTRSESAAAERRLARRGASDGTRSRSDSATSNIRQRIDAGLTTLAEVCDRLAFVRPPFDLANIAAVADEFDAGLIVLDYIQRIQPPGEHGDKRGSVDATMNHLRAFADAGVAVSVAVGSRTNEGQARPVELLRRRAVAGIVPRIERVGVRGR